MLTPLKMKENAKHIVYIFIWHFVKYCVSWIFPSVDDEKVCSKGGEDKGGVGEESNPPNPPGMVSSNLPDMIYIKQRKILHICMLTSKYK